MIATLKLKKKKKCRNIIQSLKNPIYEEYNNIKKKGVKLPFTSHGWSCHNLVHKISLVTYIPLKFEVI